jgi:hypothetical protein
MHVITHILAALLVLALGCMFWLVFAQDCDREDPREQDRNN